MNFELHQAFEAQRQESVLRQQSLGIVLEDRTAGADAIETDYVTWRNAVMPRWYKKPDGWFHKQAWDKIWSVTDDPVKAPRPLLLPWFRFAGKSATIRGGAVCLAARRKRRFFLYFSAVQDAADRHVVNIARMLQTQEMARYYPDLSQPMLSQVTGSQVSWSRQQVVTRGGIVFVSLGLDSAARGINWEEIRPDVIVVDDIDKLRDSVQVVQNKIEVLGSDIFPAGQENTWIVFAQNVIHSQSVMRRTLDGTSGILNDHDCIGPVPAVLRMEYQKRVNPESGKPRFFITSGRSSWPEGYSLEVAEDHLNKVGPMRYEREFQHNTDLLPSGAIYPGYNPLVHIVTRSELAREFAKGGVRFHDANGRFHVPHHWTKAMGHDYGCLTLDTEILTREGWKSHNGLEIGEQVASFDWEGGRQIVWTPLLGKVYKENEPLVEIKSKSFRFVCTPDHSWIVRRRKRGKMRAATYRRQPLNLISKGQTSLVVAAKCAAVGDIDCTDAEAAVLAWIVTDGWVEKRGGGAVLCQKNYPEVVIRDLQESGLEWKELKPAKSGVRFFRLRRSARECLYSRTQFTGKASLPMLAARMPPSARKRMLETMLIAEGTANGTNRMAVFCQNHGPVMDAFQILATLEGVRLGVERDHVAKLGVGQRVALLRTTNIAFVNQEVRPLEGLHEVWCPTVKEGCVVARYRGQITITGNTTVEHPTAIKWVTTPPEFEPFGPEGVRPGLVIWYRERTLPKYPFLPGDAQEPVSPMRVAGVIHEAEAYAREADNMKLRVMSHEQSAAQLTYNFDFDPDDANNTIDSEYRGLGFQKVRPDRWGGITTMQNFFEVDYSQPNQFRRYPKGYVLNGVDLSGQPVPGKVLMVFVVADGQGELYVDESGALKVTSAVDDGGMIRSRAERMQYTEKVNVSGDASRFPNDFFNDQMDAERNVPAKAIEAGILFVSAAEAPEDERDEHEIASVRPDLSRAAIAARPAGAREGALVARMMIERFLKAKKEADTPAGSALGTMHDERRR